MSAIKLNEEELEALAGLPSLALRIYILGIRPHMDYSTALVGQQRRVSWQSLREAGYVEPHQGLTDTGTPSKMQVRRAVEWLIRAGVLVERTQGKRLVFYCPLAHTDSSAQEKPDTNPTQTRHTQPDTYPDTPEPPPNRDSAAKPNTNPDTNPTYPDQAKPDTPPVSGVRGVCGDHTHMVDTSNGEGSDPGAGASVCDTAPKTSRQGERRDQRFEEWWAVYPKKVGKKPAREKWKAKRLDERADELIADVQLRIGSDRRWLAGYIPDPKTYLHQERWDDEIEREQPRLQAIPGGKGRRRGAEGNDEAVRAFLEES